jgi:hypothetical protein
MATEVEVSVETPEDKAAEMKEDEKKKAAKKAALKTLLNSKDLKSETALTALLDLIEKD